MISPELLRKHSFFGLLDDHGQKTLAMIASELVFDEGEKIFERGEGADALYFLLEGYVDLYYSSEDMSRLGERGIPVGTVNPGEPFSISALISPHVLTSTAWTSSKCRVLKMDASELRDLFAKDRRMAYALTLRAAQAALDRLHATRVQLAAAWA